jgi:hypothetical protein
MTPCEENPDRFTPRKDNPHTRKLCQSCFRRLACALETIEQIDKGLHPTGIRAGVWMPDDKRRDGKHSTPSRRHSVNQVRSIAMVLTRAKPT